MLTWGHTTRRLWRRVFSLRITDGPGALGSLGAVRRPEITAEIDALRTRIARLERELAEAREQLRELRREEPVGARPRSDLLPTVTAASSSAEKLALFRALHRQERRLRNALDQRAHGEVRLEPCRARRLLHRLRDRC